jgi:lipocalin
LAQHTYAHLSLHNIWNIQLPDNKTAVTVWNTGIDPNGTFSEICGSGTVPDPNFPGELAINFGSGPVPANYLVIGYDYDNYASVYYCAFGRELAWVLTRSQAPTEDVASLKNNAFL